MFFNEAVSNRAGANTTQQTGKVMTIIYMDKNMKLKILENDNQINDRHTWMPGAEIGKKNKYALESGNILAAIIVCDFKFRYCFSPVMNDRSF